MTSIHEPVLSAIIPTHNRADLVRRAVYSVLNQTFTDLEVVVVIDGPDEVTLRALSDISDERVRSIALSACVGGSMARNFGVSAARGRWVAFLDDDDEWLPQKIDKQLALAAKSRFKYPIVSSQLIRRTSGRDEIWPRRVPTPPVSEYLFSRHSWAGGEGLISTITILAPTELFGLCEFRSSLRRHQEWDWLLRCLRQPGTGIEFVPEPLAIWHVAQGRTSVSSPDNWEFSLDWLHEIRECTTPRAYAGFIATLIAPQASAQRAWRVFFPLLWEMTLDGAPRLMDYCLYLGMWLPKQLRRKVACLYIFFVSIKNRCRTHCRLPGAVAISSRYRTNTAKVR